MKATFHKVSDRVKWLRSVVDHPFFDEALTCAFAEYAQNLGATPGDEHKVHGAIKALNTLKNLPDIETPDRKFGLKPLMEQR